MTTDFNGFGLPPKLLQSLARIDFTTPTPIQIQTIPLVLEGRDVLGSAQTGTGKTGAFGIPVIAKLMEDPDAMAIILTPTRELASQVAKALEEMIPVPTIKTALLIGGEPMPKQFRQLNQSPRLIVGTPGRVTDHLDRGSLKLDNVRFLILDETDRMLDMGFGIQIERIVKFIPKQRQTLLFSATMPKNIVSLSSKYMHNPERVEIGSSHIPLAKIQQELIHTTDIEKYKCLLEQLDLREGSVIIFVKTKHGTERLAKKLNSADYSADAIHGDLQQRRRDRVIRSFRDKEYRILVATDVAARGLDIPHIEHVINYDLPQCPEDYIHRIGRTARAGAEGKAVNLITPADNEKWRAIHRLIHGDAQDAPTSGGRGGRSGGRGGRDYGPPRGGRRPYTPSTGRRKFEDEAPRPARKSYGDNDAVSELRVRDDGDRPARAEAPKKRDYEPRAERKVYGERGASAPRSRDEARPARAEGPKKRDYEPRTERKSYDSSEPRRERSAESRPAHRQGVDTEARPARKIYGERGTSPTRTDRDSEARPSRKPFGEKRDESGAKRGGPHGKPAGGKPSWKKSGPSRSGNSQGKAPLAKRRSA